MKNKIVISTTLIYFLALIIFPLKNSKLCAMSTTPLGTYVTPNFKPGNIQIVRVEITVKNSEDETLGKITQASFNGHPVTIRSSDGSRMIGNLHTKVTPGSYEVKWVIDKQRKAYPRTQTHKEQVTISKETLWVDILIEGDQLYAQGKEEE